MNVSKQFAQNVSLLLFSLALSFLFAGCEQGFVAHPGSTPGPTPATVVQGVEVNEEEDTSDWTSGGGYAPNDQFNPWFVKNTKVVNYCIEIDEENFGLDLATSKEAVREAFDYWQKEFKLNALHMELSGEAFSDGDTDYYAELGGQSFEEGPCSESTDIRFQLGTLSARQKTAVANLSNYLAFTVRTNYDPKLLRGKGFIYVAPVKGDLIPRMDYVSEDRWKVENSLFLRLLMTHEVGHVFGMTNSEHPIMESDIMDTVQNYYVEKELHEESADLSRYKGSLDLLLSTGVFPSETRSNCAEGWEKDAGFGALPLLHEVACFRLKTEIKFPDSDSSAGFHFQIEVSQDGMNWLPYAKGSVTSSNSRVSYLTKVFLTPEQQVFKPSADNFRIPFFLGPPVSLRRTTKGLMHLNSELGGPNFWKKGQNAPYAPEPLIVHLVDGEYSGTPMAIHVPAWEADPHGVGQYAETLQHLYRNMTTSYSLTPPAKSEGTDLSPLDNE